MSDPVIPAAPAAPSTPAAPAAPVTPAAPAAPAAPATPAAPAAPATSAAPAAPAASPAAKSLLDQAAPKGTEAPAVSPVVAAQNAALALYEAVKAWQANPTPETKAVADKALADSTAAAEAAKAVPAAAAGVPEKYELKPIEGITFDEKQLEAFTPVAKKLGLSNDAVNELVAFQANANKAAAASQEKADLEAWNANQEKQTQESKVALGAKWQEELAFAAKARDTFFSKEAVEALNFAGVANNIHVLNAFIKMGKQISEATHVDGVGKGEEKSAAKTLYGS